MKKIPHFNSGDRVRHSQRPEWGLGKVLTVNAVMHEGERYQRLSVQFEHHGRANIHTAYAPLVSADAQSSTESQGSPAAIPSASPATAEPAATVNPRDALLTLPADATDQSAPLASRLRATLGLYRYAKDERGAYAWAVAQTQLPDPLAVFTRHEIDQANEHFCYLRDKHLRMLHTQAKRAGKVETLLQIGRLLEPHAQMAIRKVLDSK